jgi:hypothetical protein
LAEVIYVSESLIAGGTPAQGASMLAGGLQ